MTADGSCGGKKDDKAGDIPRGPANEMKMEMKEMKMPRG